MAVDVELLCRIMGNIGQLWLQEDFTDIVIEVEGQRFHCHQLVLSACSNFFSKILNPSVEKVDKKEHVCKTILIKNINPSIFQLVLNAVYKGENSLSTDNMCELWHAVHVLEIPVFLTICENFICKHIDRDNVLCILNLALMLQSNEIIKQCFSFFTKDLEYFLNTTENIFLRLSAAAVGKLVESEKLQRTSQVPLISFILKWVEFGKSIDELCLENKTGNKSTSLGTDDKVNEDECCDLEKSVALNSERRIMDTHAIGTMTHTLDFFEITFPKLPVPGSQLYINRFLCSPSQDHSARKESLGKLLKQFELNKISTECLEMLADNDLVMGTKETRDLVRQALSSNSQGQQKDSTACLSLISTDSDLTECIVAYQVENDSAKIYGYSLEKSKIFHIMHSYDLKKMYSKNNQLILHVNSRCLKNDKCEYSLQIRDISSSGSFPLVKEHKFCGTNAVVIENFLYITQDNRLIRKNLSLENDIWTDMFMLHEDSSLYSIAVYKNYIILYRKEPEKDHYLTAYRFNSETRIGSRVLYRRFIGHTLVCVEARDSLYLVSNTGYCFNVIPETTSDIITQNPNPYIWKESLGKHFGAVLYKKNLIVFTDSSKTSINEMDKKTVPVNTIMPEADSVEFRHLYNAVDCCLLTVPSLILTEEM